MDQKFVITVGRQFGSGGRVIGATAVGDTLEAAIEKAYAAARGITFEGAYMRSDIGQRALRAKEG